MFNRRSNVNDLRLDCTYCDNSAGKPFCNDSDCTVVKCKCGAVFDGYSDKKERSIYDAQKD